MTGDLDQAEGRKTAPESLDMHRPLRGFWRHRSPPVHRLQKQRKLRRGQHHSAVDQRRPDEAMALEPLGEQAVLDVGQNDLRRRRPEGA